MSPFDPFLADVEHCSSEIFHVVSKLGGGGQRRPKISSASSSDSDNGAAFGQRAVAGHAEARARPESTRPPRPPDPPDEHFLRMATITHLLDLVHPCEELRRLMTLYFQEEFRYD
jgi:hypothetical protein